MLTLIKNHSYQEPKEILTDIEKEEVRAELLLTKGQLKNKKSIFQYDMSKTVELISIS